MDNNIIIGDELLSVKCNGKCKYCFLSGDCPVERMRNSIKRHKREIAAKNAEIAKRGAIIKELADALECAVSGFSQEVVTYGEAFALIEKARKMMK